MKNISHLVGKKVKVFMIDKDDNQIVTTGTLYKHNSRYVVCPHGRLLSRILSMLVKDYTEITCAFEWYAVKVVEGNKVYIIARSYEVD